MSNTEGFYYAEFRLDTRDPPHRLTPEHCRANRSKMRDIGRHRNEQVRIEFLTANGTIMSAIYTVSVFHNDEELVLLGNKLHAQMQNCQLSKNACRGKVKAHIMIEGLDDNDSKAEELGELIEHLSHEDQNNRLIVIAPHGGEIESWTDEQAKFVAGKFSSNRASLWVCKGFSSKGNADALERWHITATEINEKSFPKLNTVVGPDPLNPRFEYAIAFHGWKENFICVGGSKESADSGLIKEIRDKIRDALEREDSDIEVKDSSCPECKEKFNGNDTENIVNRLGKKGIQIEQCKKARDNFHIPIAQAVVNAIGSLINT